jgi:hypothetical protein
MIDREDGLPFFFSERPEPCFRQQQHAAYVPISRAVRAMPESVLSVRYRRDAILKL